ncbi:Coq4 family protein [Nannocystis sp.]|uniref:Coq4 family protein n=1 Tax=Nannocystis sp. TaxID=1962667 RepID=UPI0025FD440C|nr:Coq4 family protein [Nannocystis sp.]MBK7826365.1 hypothetical protein [Nannocystis sp.]
MFDSFKKLKLAGAFLGAADDAAAAPESLDISELFGRLSLKDLRGMTLQADTLLDQPGVRALYETHYMPPAEPLDKLHDLGEGTLGFEYVRYLRHYKLPQPQLPRRSDYAEAADYLLQRVRMTHALLHVLTEYDASPLGELALQAYYIGQLGNMISGVIVSSAILQITRDTPELLGPALEVTSEAFQRGKAARTFLGVAWEELWSAQVPQLRELIEIPARTSSVAQLRIEAPARPAPEPRNSSSLGSGRSGVFSVSAFAGAEDGLAALGRSASPSPPPQPRVFSGFGSAPASSLNDPAPTRPAPTRPAPARAEPAAPVERPRNSSTSNTSSSLLASFMALSEEAAHEPEPKPAPKPEPKPEPKSLAPRPEPPPIPTAKPAPPPLPVRPPAVPEPTYKVEDQAKHIVPALTPDDPDYF